MITQLLICGALCAGPADPPAPAGGARAPASELRFKRVVIAAESDFEAAGVGDVDRDGQLDIVCGDTWYRGGDWSPRRLASIRDAGGYRVDFADELLDVDGDGWLDVVSCSWHDRAVLWRRNPGAAPTAEGELWEERRVDEPGNMETALAADVDGDGALDFLPDVAQQTVWYRVENGGLKRHVVSADIGGHGIGFGDVNGDGRGDILKPSGWFEAPADPRAGDWQRHAEWDLGAASIGILVHDFTGDGRADVVWGMGHDYGIFWLEQTTAEDPRARWVRREIDREWSQAHALRLADFDGDGTPEFLTGKRRFAHNGHDPGGQEPPRLCIYRYEAADQRFARQIVHQGGLDGAGLAPVVADMNDDGRLDFVAPGKGGLYLYLQQIGTEGSGGE